jgi:DNA-binding beta-propeller fold protein YncE
MAQIDYTLGGGIRWPGPPEQARIQYLWSLQRVSGAETRGVLGRLVAGEEDPLEDPRSSGLLNRPQGLFVDERNVLYVADPGAYRVSVVNLDTLESFHITKWGDRDLFSPVGVAANPEGRIFVTDAELGTVLVFDPQGKFVKAFVGRFERPTGIAISPATGRVYVADTWGHMVYVHDTEGRRLMSFGGRGEEPGRLNYPTHLALDRDGRLYVSDSLNFRVQVFSPAGEYLASFGSLGDTFRDFEKIKGIGVDGEGHVYVADSAQDMVKIFNREGQLLLFFGSRGSFYGRFFLPTGIFVDRRDRIFVSDSLNRRIQVFQFLGS